MIQPQWLIIKRDLQEWPERGHSHTSVTSNFTNREKALFTATFTFKA